MVNDQKFPDRQPSTYNTGIFFPDRSVLSGNFQMGLEILPWAGLNQNNIRISKIKDFNKMLIYLSNRKLNRTEPENKIP